MLPTTVQFIIAMITYAINERMARKLDYLQDEVQVLMEALGRPLVGSDSIYAGAAVPPCGQWQRTDTG